MLPTLLSRWPTPARPGPLVLGELAVCRLWPGASPTGFEAQLRGPAGRRPRCDYYRRRGVRRYLAGGRARLDWVLGDGADAAIVELGANDGLRGLDPQDTEENLARDPRQAGGEAHPGAADRHVCDAESWPGLCTRIPRGVRPAGAAAWRALRSVLPEGRGGRPGADPARRAASERGRREAHRRRLLPLVEKLLQEVPPA